MEGTPTGTHADNPIPSAVLREQNHSRSAIPLPGSIGILPPGALGVAFFYHLTQNLTRLDRPILFLGLSGSQTIKSFKTAGIIRIRDQSRVRHLPIADRIIVDLQAAYESARLPEVVLIATNPDQLFSVVDDMIALLERLHEDHLLEQEPLPFPSFIFCANGIYFQRLRQVFVEKLEESTLLGRLPDLWPNLMPKIVGRMMRGVTIQPGLRDGTGSSAIYQPGDSAVTKIAGGDATERKRCVDLLQETGAWFDLESVLSPTRIEFDKAILNLTGNLLGIIYSTDDEGDFKPLNVGQIFASEHRDDVQELAGVVLRIGKSVKAYGANESLERITADLDRIGDTLRDHIPSSLQYVSMLLSRGQLKGECTPTEEWLLQPLIKYAEAAGLHESSAYLRGLRERLVAKLTAASRAAGGITRGHVLTFNKND
jgi:hypothetical protein